MGFVEAAACLMPPLVAFLATGVLAWRLEQGSPRKAARDAVMAAKIPLLLFCLAGLAAGSFALSLKAAAVALAFAAFAAGVFLLLVSCRVRPAAAQATVGVIVVMLMGGVFLAGSVIDAAPLSSREARGDFLVRINPYVVIASDICGVDVLRSPTLYATHLADYVRSAPPWPGIAGGYFALGLLMAGMGFGVRRALGAG